MLITVDKYFGLALCNAIRQAALTKIECVRPIAFRVGYGSTVIYTSDSVEEDMTEFIAGVSGGIFASNDYETKIYRSVVQADGVLKLSGITNGTDRVVLVSDDEEVLHTLAPEQVTVYFRLGHGCYSVAENRGFLAAHGEDPDKYTVVSSRHSNVTVCTYQVVAEEGEQLSVEFSVQTADGSSEEEVLSAAMADVARASAELK